MSKILILALFIPTLVFGAALTTGCSKTPEVIMAVPLCDCSHDPANPRADCWEGYVCEPGAACSHDGGLFDKCVPQGSYAPHEHAPSN